MMDFTTALLHDANTKDLIAMAGAMTKLTHHGHYWSGPCPLCRAGTDRFVIKQRPDGEYRWYCRQCGDNKYHDVIDYVVQIENVPFDRAVEILTGEQIKLRSLSAEEIAERQRIHAAEQAARMKQLEESTREFATHEIWELFCKRMTDENKAWWRKQGIPDVWQEFWKLGYTPEKCFEFEGTFYRSPAYTIPKFDYNWQAVNIDYRLLEYPAGVGKYRPAPDLPPAAFLSRPDCQAVTDQVIIVEGSKKAMVTTIYNGADNYHVHVFGIPSKNSWAGIAEKVKNCGRVWIALDPDATEWAFKLGAAIGANARIIELPYKPDDGFLLYGMTPELWREAQKYARMPKGTTKK
jgi:hypothetical protein